MTLHTFFIIASLLTGTTQQLCSDKAGGKQEVVSSDGEHSSNLRPSNSTLAYILSPRYLRSLGRALYDKRILPDPDMLYSSQALSRILQVSPAFPIDGLPMNSYEAYSHLKSMWLQLGQGKSLLDSDLSQQVLEAVRPYLFDALLEDLRPYEALGIQGTPYTIRDIVQPLETYVSKRIFWLRSLRPHLETTIPDSHIKVSQIHAFLGYKLRPRGFAEKELILRQTAEELEAVSAFMLTSTWGRYRRNLMSSIAKSATTHPFDREKARAYITECDNWLKLISQQQAAVPPQPVAQLQATSQTTQQAQTLVRETAGGKRGREEGEAEDENCEQFKKAHRETTIEKSHKCTYPGCNEAFPRAARLKTHEPSHAKK